MKNLSKIIFALVMTVCSTCIFSACNREVEIESAEIKNNTISNQVLLGGDLDLSNLIVIVKYEDGETKQISKEDITISDLDTSKVGEETFTITYKGYSFTHTVNVVREITDDIVKIMQLESTLLNNFESNRASSEEQISFVKKDQPLYVGNDNEFHFDMVASGIDEEGDRVAGITAFPANINVWLGSGKDKQLLSEEAAKDYVEIDYQKATFLFNDDALNKQFTIKVAPSFPADGYADAIEGFTGTVNVVDGYNVYTADQLSVYDNANQTNHDENGHWTAFKEARGLDDIETNGIILQRNISIKDENLPASYFYDQADVDALSQEKKESTDQEILGSLKDTVGFGLYERYIDADDAQFNFIGNYFTVSAKDVSLMVLGQDGSAVNEKADEMMATQTTLFLNRAAVLNPANGVKWENVAFSGNGELSSEVVLSGSMLLLKNYEVDFISDNTICNNFCIGYYFTNYDTVEVDAQYHILNSKGFNFYNAAFYVRAAQKLIIENCTIKDAGGPAIMAEDKGAKNGNSYTDAQTEEGAVCIDIINSDIVSQVSGSENWFQQYKASDMFKQLAGLEAFYNGVGFKDNPLVDPLLQAGIDLNNTGKTIISDVVNDGEKDIPLFNLIAVVKGDGNSLGAVLVDGYIRQFKNRAEYDAYYKETDAIKNVYGLDMGVFTEEHRANMQTKAMSKGSIYVQSSGNGGYINQNAGSNGDSTIIPSNPKDPATYVGLKDYWTGDFLNVFIYNGFGVMIELFDVEK